MSDILLTEKKLLKKYAGKYIDTFATFDYTLHQWFYMVRGVSNTIRENYNLPEDCIVQQKN